MNPNKPNRLFALSLELFEEVTSYLDYLSLRSLSSTSHVAQRSLIPKSHLISAMLALELYDDAEIEILKSKALLPCYQCLQVFPAESGFEMCDTDPDEAGFTGEFACARMCTSCNYKAGGYFSRAPKWERLRKVRMRMLKRRGWAPAGREEIYRVRREREETVRLGRARQMKGKAWVYDGGREKWEVIDDPLAAVTAGQGTG